MAARLGVNPLHFLVRFVPVRGDLPLRVSQEHRPAADRPVQEVLQHVLLAGTRRGGVGLRPEVRHVVGAADFKRDQVIHLAADAGGLRRPVEGIDLGLEGLGDAGRRGYR